MPNHVTNILTIVTTKKRLAEIRKQIILDKDVDDYPYINFEAIIPVPDIIKEVGEISSNIKVLIVDFVKTGRLTYKTNLTKDDLVEIEKAKKALKETGYAYWYDFKINEWGTKWNAYDQELIKG